MLYIGAEFCPICAAQRWSMVVALSNFGTFSNLSETHSAAQDGDIATLSFYNSVYTSNYLTFTAVEATTNQPDGGYYKSLETPSKLEKAIWSKYEGKDLAFPFIDIGGQWILKTAQYDFRDLSGLAFSDIVNDIASSNSKVGAEIDASAAVLTKYICTVTDEQPSNVCGAVASVPLPR